MSRVPATTIAAVLRGLTSGDASRPLVTFYDDATGERVELSVKSFDNWVAKTANLLQHGLAAEPGDRLAVTVPTHWQGMVWLCAAWSCGLVVGFDGAAGQADYAVVGPSPAPAEARATIGLSLRPLGVEEAPPPGVLDYRTEVLGYADSFEPLQALTADIPALDTGDTVLSQGELIAHGAEVAAGLGLGAAPRLLTDANPCSVDGVGTALLAPLVTGGSLVLVRHPDPDREVARVSEERVTARVLGVGDEAG